MSIPALSKSYAVKGNIPYVNNATATALLQNAIWLLKQNLINGTISGGTAGSHARNANSVWTVLGSSDSSTASINDGVDRWTDYTKVVCAASGSAHSWILLHNATLGYDVLIDANSTTTNLRLAATKTSDAVFTGGSTTTGPTSTSEFNARTNSTGASQNGTFLGDVITAGTNYAHFQTDDSGHFFFALSRAGTNVFHGFCAFTQTVNPSGSDTRNTLLWMDGNSGGRGVPQTSNMSSQLLCSMRTINNVITAQGGWSMGNTFGSTAASGAQGTDGGSSQYLAYPCHIYNFTAQAAYRGQVPDVYFVNTATVSGSYPSAAAQTHVIFGDMIIAYPDVNLLV